VNRSVPLLVLLAALQLAPASAGGAEWAAALSAGPTVLLQSKWNPRGSTFFTVRGRGTRSVGKTLAVGVEAAYSTLGTLAYGCANTDGGCLEPSQGNVFAAVSIVEAHARSGRTRPYVYAGGGAYGIRSYGQELTPAGPRRKWVPGVTGGVGFTAAGSPGFGLETKWELLFDGQWPSGYFDRNTQFLSFLATLRFH